MRTRSVHLLAPMQPPAASAAAADVGHGRVMLRGRSRTARLRSPSFASCSALNDVLARPGCPRARTLDDRSDGFGGQQERPDTCRPLDRALCASWNDNCTSR